MSVESRLAALETAMQRLDRRAKMTHAAVKITATDDTGPVHKVQAKGFPPEQIDNLAVMQLYGVASHAMPGSDATAHFISGDRSNGFIVATNNQQYRLRNLKAGQVALYDSKGTVIKLSDDGNIAITCGKDAGNIDITCGKDTGTITMTAPTEIKLMTPKVTISGVIDVLDTDGTGDVGTFNGILRATVDVISNTVSGVNHVHTGVQPGGGDTGKPVP